ncbi:MAG: ATP-binding protein [Nostoc sp.]|uniref:ATP-binding protein n=1 Tax=Nostoc sp. TaxID=1180 RepID=UPI002FF4537D
MSDTQPLPLSIQPVISYPREAKVGETYMMTIDLKTPGGEWLYEEEEYTIDLMLDTLPLFRCQAVGEPSLVLHRFGGTYGAAKFLLTAAQEEMEGKIRVTLVNKWGVPIRVLSLDQISVTQGVTDSPVTIVNYKPVTSVAQKWVRNPYIIGRPIYEPNKFFGRESLFHFIQDNLFQGVKVILLHGQRRIGKSSVLKQIPNFIQSDEFIFVEFDLQDKSQSSLSDIIHDLATAITEQLEIEVDELKPPSNAELEQNINLFSEVFLPIIYEKIEHKKVVLLLDQFDLVKNDNNDINIGEQHRFFPYLKKVLKEQDRLFIIPVIERYLNDLPNLLNLFKDASIQEIGLLDDISAKRMIANPAEGILTYEPEAIKEILKLSAGHPCYTQVICFALFEQAREKNKSRIELADVKSILEKSIEKADSFFQSFWQGLTVEERIIMSAVAEAQKIAIEQGKRIPEEALDLLSRNGINETEQLLEAWERVIGNRYLYDNGRKVKVELIRLWLLQFHSLENEIQNLKIEENKNIEDIINNLIVTAIFWSQKAQYNLELQLYKQGLEMIFYIFNKILLFLAEQYLQTKDFEKSLQLYEQLYQADSQSYKEGCLDALSEYGHHLIITREYTLAKEQYNKILQIEPNRKFATQKILEIETYEKNM